MSNDSPSIGEQLTSETMTIQIRRLLELAGGFCAGGISEETPISCQVEGRAASLQDLSYLMPGQVKVLVYFENYGKVVRSTWAEFTSFFCCREPWQDYDVCVFSEVDTWCIAISHNEKVTLLGMPNVQKQGA